MRTYIRTEVTLNTVFWLPCRYVYGNASFFIGGCSARGRSVYILFKCRNWQTISFLSIYLLLNNIYKVYNVFPSTCCSASCNVFVFCIFPAFWYFNFYNLLCASVYSVIIHFYYLLAFSSISSFCS